MRLRKRQHVSSCGAHQEAWVVASRSQVEAWQGAATQHEASSLWEEAPWGVAEETCQEVALPEEAEELVQHLLQAMQCTISLQPRFDTTSAYMHLGTQPGATTWQVQGHVHESCHQQGYHHRMSGTAFGFAVHPQLHNCLSTADHALPICGEIQRVMTHLYLACRSGRVVGLLVVGEGLQHHLRTGTSKLRALIMM